MANISQVSNGYQSYLCQATLILTALPHPALHPHSLFSPGEMKNRRKQSAGDFMRDGSLQEVGISMSFPRPHYTRNFFLSPYLYFATCSLEGSWNVLRARRLRDPLHSNLPPTPHHPLIQQKLLSIL